MRENVELWLKQSLEDLDTARVLLNNNKYYASAFYSHQAAEKALKALLYFGKDIKTHDLSKMLDIIKEEVDLNVEEIRKEALKLNPNYTISRDPDAANSLPYLLYDKNDAEEYLKIAKKIINWVKKFIK
ncbi:MAG: HEPN domain-containing protein [Candidatus Nanopusillus sp.]|nr:HEPN domain-containing protein [Candidatus Nanopusillus sp.]